MRDRLITLTGATGFIGSAVLRELARQRGAGSALRIRVVGRGPTDEVSALADEWVSADLARPATLSGVCEDADVLLHLAALIGSDEARCTAVNVDGTRALMAEASRAGVGRIVHLSTAAVYGPGPHRGIEVNGVRPAPVSAASRSRLAAEEYALAAGATVVRPGLVLGPGDRWVVPALAELLDKVPALWDAGRARLSVVDVADLARLVVGLAQAPRTDATVFHAAHPEPVRTGDLLAALARHGVLPEVEATLSWPECLDQLACSASWVSERQFSLLAQDHWYASDEVWPAARCAPGPGPLARLDEAAASWYRSFLGR